MIHNYKIGIIPASFMGISAIIGSGWLFAPLLAASISGPAAIFAWVIGAIIILVLALCFSEIASLYPLRGLSAVITSISHNKFFGFPFAIANWLGIVAVIALEADATVQYILNLTPQLSHVFIYQGTLTIYGNIFSSIVVLLFSLINLWGISLLTRTNNIITLIKLFVPIFAIVILAFTAFHKENFTAVNHSFTPYGINSIIQTILVAGIIVSFNGFQAIISYASEIDKPHRTIPISITISIVTCLVIYLCIQITFIGALPTDMVKNGWDKIHMAAPMIELLTILGLHFFTIIIYVGSTATPMGTAINFTGSATRMFTAMARQNQVPKYFDKVHPKFKISRRSLIFNTILAISFLFIFKSWTNLAQILSLLHVLSYLTVPIAMIVFRKNTPKNNYKFYMPFGILTCYLLFIIFNYLISYAELYIVIYLATIIIIFQAIFIFVNIKNEWENMKENASSVIKLMLYIAALPLMSYLHYTASAGIFTIICIIFSIISLYLLTQQSKKQKINHKH